MGPRCPRPRTSLVVPKTRRLIGGVVATFAAFAVLPLGTAEVAHAAGGTTYYVSPSGSDSASGTDPSHAFRSVGRVSNLDLQPGDEILLRAWRQLRRQARGLA